VLISYSLLIFMEQNELLSVITTPLIFFCALYLTVWVVFQYRTGEITITSTNGMSYRNTRKNDKFFFFLYIGIIFILGFSLTILIGSDLLGCEWSLINSCAATYE